MLGTSSEITKTKKNKIEEISDELADKTDRNESDELVYRDSSTFLKVSVFNPNQFKFM